MCIRDRRATAPSSSPVVARVSFVGDVLTDFSRARRRVRASPLASPLARRSSDARGAEPTICEDRIVVASDGAISAGKIDPSRIVNIRFLSVSHSLPGRMGRILSFQIVIVGGPETRARPTGWTDRGV